MQKIWRIKKIDLESSARLSAKLKIPPLVAQLLTARGISNAKDAQEYLYPTFDMLHSPFLMNGMSKAVERVKRAMDNGEQIWIYGDYDVDGTTAASLLILFFKHYGVAANYYIPNRFDEGYGLNVDAIAKLNQAGCNLLISADCGVSSVEEVELANKLGIDVIVTDHHEPKPEGVAPAYVLLNPRLPDCNYPFKRLAGVGVAFKLVHALMGGEEFSPFLTSQLDLVALGTVVDVVSLVEENRILAKFGLEELNKRERQGIRALCDVAEHEAKITEYTLGFVIGPRLNAAGRLDTARKVVELLTTDDYTRALEIARVLDAENHERQRIQREILEDTIEKIKRSVDTEKEKALVLADESWHQGVIGIVASKLAERYYRPTILVSLDGDEGHGSGRSIPEFNFFQGLSECKELLLGFGGHKAAAGLKIKRDKIPELRVKFSQVVESKLTAEDLTPKVEIDLEVNESQLHLNAVEELELLAPYGMGNPRPFMKICDTPMKVMPFLVKNRHLKFIISDGLEAIGWNMSQYLVALKNRGIKVDLVFQPEINEWKDKRTVQLKLEDINIRRFDPKDTVFPLMNVESRVKIVDRRNHQDKSEYLRQLLARGAKTLLYVRDDAMLGKLQDITTQKCGQIPLGLLNAGADSEERQRILAKLESEQLTTVATAENIPGAPYVRHLVFCHPVHTLNDFWERCKPAFETEELTYIHLIFGQADMTIMLDALRQKYPQRDTLGKLYRIIRNIVRENGSLVDVEKILARVDDESIKEQTVESGFAIFKELELLKEENGHLDLLPEPESKRGLDESELFLQGEYLRQTAVAFADFLMKKTAEEIFHTLSSEMKERR